METPDLTLDGTREHGEIDLFRSGGVGHEAVFQRGKPALQGAATSAGGLGKRTQESAHPCVDEGVVGGDSIRWRGAQSGMTNWCKWLSGTAVSWLRARGFDCQEFRPR